MTRRLLWTCAVALLTFPIAALADVTGTPTLAVNTMLNLDTGTTGSSGGDLLWTGSSLVPQPGVGVFSFPAAVGAAVYNSLTQASLALFTYSSTPVSPVTNGVVACKTKSGNYAKILVTSVTA
ncbi:MAG TPA: hypothetical protein VGZ73_11940, partial [Bryobacteraceae bacterium]|nr:hypothetical protein [Bryobacteraceae bacterium]